MKMFHKIKIHILTQIKNNDDNISSNTSQNQTNTNNKSTNANKEKINQKLKSIDTKKKVNKYRNDINNAYLADNKKSMKIHWIATDVREKMKACKFNSLTGIKKLFLLRILLMIIILMKKSH